MKAFEYAAPRRESEVCAMLASASGSAEIVAGGTDVVGLMKKMIVNPARVVNIKEVASLRGISADSTGVTIGATTTLDEILESPHLDEFPAVKQVIRNIASPQLQQQGTLGGELCQRPQCWYYRNGYGLLESAGLIEQGQNRYHAIFGNEGPAKFVSPSRLAPALVALGAQIRVIGSDSELRFPVEALYRTPQVPGERELVLEPDQLVTHVHLPKSKLANASYEVRHGEGPDYPLAACSAALEIRNGVVTNAQIVLGHVAPMPWISAPAAEVLVGRSVTADSARETGEAAVAWATPLSDNGYKVQLAKVAVERAIKLAAGLPTGGF